MSDICAHFLPSSSRFPYKSKVVILQQSSILPDIYTTDGIIYHVEILLKQKKEAPNKTLTQPALCNTKNPSKPLTDKPITLLWQIVITPLQAF